MRQSRTDTCRSVGGWVTANRLRGNAISVALWHSGMILVGLQWRVMGYVIIMVGLSSDTQLISCRLTVSALCNIMVLRMWPGMQRYGKAGKSHVYRWRQNNQDDINIVNHWY